MAKTKTNNKLALAEKKLSAIAAKLDLAETYFEDGAVHTCMGLVREAKEMAEED